jgi:hypothetical protein
VPKEHLGAWLRIILALALKEFLPASGRYTHLLHQSFDMAAVSQASQDFPAI